MRTSFHARRKEFFEIYPDKQTRATMFSTYVFDVFLLFCYIMLRRVFWRRTALNLNILNLFVHVFLLLEIFHFQFALKAIAWFPQKRELRLKLAQQSSSQWSLEQASLVFNLLELNSEPAGSSKNMAQLPTRVYRFHSEQNFEELNKRLSLSSQTYVELSIFFFQFKNHSSDSLGLGKSSRNAWTK